MGYNLKKKKESLIYQMYRTADKKLPSQMYHGPKLPKWAYHVVHPLLQSQMSDSRLDSGFHSQPALPKNFENNIVSVLGTLSVISSFTLRVYTNV